MSYNITIWKTKKLDNLVIPLNSFYKHERKDWHPDKPVITNAETMEVSLKCGCEQEVKGILKNGNLHISELDMSGDGSGYLMECIIKPALADSTGVLEAKAIWEHGDSVSLLTVKDGVVEDNEVEL